MAESQRPYYDYRDELSIENGIVLKGEAILVPKSLRAEMKERAHTSHLGYDSMMRRLKGTLFWPGMTRPRKSNSCVTSVNHVRILNREMDLKH